MDRDELHQAVIEIAHCLEDAFGYLDSALNKIAYEEDDGYYTSISNTIWEIMLFKDKVYLDWLKDMAEVSYTILEMNKSENNIGK